MAIYITHGEELYPLTPVFMPALSELKVKHLGAVTFEELYNTHHRAFKDYPFQWSAESLARTMNRRGYAPELSFGLFHNNELVSFTMNGIGMFNGIKTAYDTGTATLEDYRGRGLASRVFEEASAALKASGIQQYLLEVLEENDTAKSVYERQGFKVTRKFDCFRQNMADWTFAPGPLPQDVELRTIGFEARAEMEAMLDFLPSWQNGFEALLRKPDDFVVTGAFIANKLVGFGLIEPDTGDVPLLGVDASHRRKGIGRMLMEHLRSLNQAPVIKVVNIPQQAAPVIQFLEACNLPKIVSQYEMIKEL